MTLDLHASAAVSRAAGAGRARNWRAGRGRPAERRKSVPPICSPVLTAWRFVKPRLDLATRQSELCLLTSWRVVGRFYKRGALSLAGKFRAALVEERAERTAL